VQRDRLRRSGASARVHARGRLRRAVTACAPCKGTRFAPAAATRSRRRGCRARAPVLLPCQSGPRVRGRRGERVQRGACDGGRALWTLCL
jgi:hypothetical protein